MENIIKISNLSFAYPGMPLILKDVNLSVNRGDYLAIIGPNGSAKTTLLKLILGILKPQSGTIELFGQNIAQFKDWPKLGYVPQRTSFFNPHFPATVQEMVGLNLAIRGTGSHKKEKIRQTLQLVGLVEKAEHQIGQLSGGQLQRALIARSLINNPQVLLLDEPTANLDQSALGKFLDLLQTLNQEMGIGIMIVTHDPEVIKRASRIVKLSKGQAVEITSQEKELMTSDDGILC